MGKYRLKLGLSILTRRGECDPTTPEGPRPLVLLKLDLRFLVFFVPPQQIKNHKVGPWPGPGPGPGPGVFWGGD